MDLLKKNKINFEMIMRNISIITCLEEEEDEIETENEKEIVKIYPKINEISNNRIELASDLYMPTHYKLDDDFNQLGKNCSNVNSLANPIKIGLNRFNSIKIGYDGFNKNKKNFPPGFDTEEDDRDLLEDENEEENIFENILE